MWAGVVAENNLSILTGVNGIYAPAPFYINTMQNLDYTKGYKVKMHQADELIVSGDSLADKSITFPQGTQIIPVLTNVEVIMADLFDGQTGKILYMLDMMQNKVYWPGGSIYTLDKLQPGRGYLANFLQSVDVEFPPMSEFTVNDFKTTPPLPGP